MTTTSRVALRFNGRQRVSALPGPPCQLAPNRYCSDLGSCAKGDMDEMAQADLMVDGVHVPNLVTRYRFKTPLFTFKYPADNVLLVSGPGVSKSAGEGIFVMLARLSAGPHTVAMHWADLPPGSTGDVTYHLTVRG